MEFDVAVQKKLSLVIWKALAAVAKNCEATTGGGGDIMSVWNGSCKEVMNISIGRDGVKTLTLGTLL